LVVTQTRITIIEKVIKLGSSLFKIIPINEPANIIGMEANANLY
jgi:hypothetical protein